MRYFAFLSFIVLLAPSVAVQPRESKLTDTEKLGQRLFLQRCALCHLGAAPSYKPYAVPLDAQVVVNRGESGVREYILRGSPTMPGWQHSLNEAQVTSVIAYLRTLKNPSSQ